MTILGGRSLRTRPPPSWGTKWHSRTRHGSTRSAARGRGACFRTPRRGNAPSISSRWRLTTAMLRRGARWGMLSGMAMASLPTAQPRCTRTGSQRRRATCNRASTTLLCSSRGRTLMRQGRREGRAGTSTREHGHLPHNSTPTRRAPDRGRCTPRWSSTLPWRRAHGRSLPMAGARAGSRGMPTQTRAAGRGAGSSGAGRVAWVSRCRGCGSSLGRAGRGARAEGSARCLIARCCI
mmetsp:Transcript_19206/g.46371  ORF Transcript_19206/g.46371 Transcript_19206/m.46371 type:complete len:236 (-) Transcript_19206:111-818(-)